MDQRLLYEVIGYVGSGLVVVSLMLRSLLRLRLVNLVGALVFTVYGVLIEAWPVVGVNGAIVLIDAWHLRDLLPRRPDHYDVIESSPGSAYVRRFLDFHAGDIARFVPEWDGLRDDHRVFLVLRNAVPGGIVVVRELAPGTAMVELDYVVPEQRDFSLGAWVYDHSGVFRDNGWSVVLAASGDAAHRRYLERMGFRPDGDRHHLDRSGHLVGQTRTRRD